MSDIKDNMAALVDKLEIKGVFGREAATHLHEAIMSASPCDLLEIYRTSMAEAANDIDDVPSLSLVIAIEDAFPGLGQG